MPLFALVDTYDGPPRAVHQARRYSVYAIELIRNEANGWGGKRKVTLTPKTPELPIHVIAATRRIKKNRLPQEWRSFGRFPMGGISAPARPAEETASSHIHRNGSARAFSSSQHSDGSKSLDCQSSYSAISNSESRRRPAYSLKGHGAPSL